MKFLLSLSAEEGAAIRALLESMRDNEHDKGVDEGMAAEWATQLCEQLDERAEGDFELTVHALAVIVYACETWGDEYDTDTDEEGAEKAAARRVMERLGMTVVVPKTPSEA